MTRILAALLTAVMVSVLAACGAPQKDEGDTMDSTRTVTQAISDYEAFLDALIARLAEEFGPREWATDDRPVTRTLCGPDDAGMKAILQDRSFKGTYDATQRDAVRDLVIAVGKEHGFDDPELVVERDDYLKVVASDTHGGQYSFGMSVNTVVGAWTGCNAPD